MIVYCRLLYECMSSVPHRPNVNSRKNPIPKRVNSNIIRYQTSFAERRDKRKRKDALHINKGPTCHSEKSFQSVPKAPNSKEVQKSSDFKISTSCLNIKSEASSRSLLQFVLQIPSARAKLLCMAALIKTSMGRNEQKKEICYEPEPCVSYLHIIQHVPPIQSQSRVNRQTCLHGYPDRNWYEPSKIFSSKLKPACLIPFHVACPSCCPE
jgi:hypothetical protein